MTPPNRPWSLRLAVGSYPRVLRSHVVAGQIDPICAAFAIRLWELRVVQIGGSSAQAGYQYGHPA
jgi:hypothetical protein